ncbi:PLASMODESMATA CALLOSE-BINDING PROTEIN 3 isoform X3 [Vigna angularis]|uniref:PLASMODESMATA CALLOSE-BINDING PROTEIN 3 isoform X3 n=1 Tax=Phaseolus angularis TaxID=3914 RepID=UPI0022B47E3C|nr:PLASMODESMATA CALLOSE-BINDING PROTEIN 3 isoform X3 [Vigna angularis]
MTLVMYFVLFLAFTGHSSALYCVCKDGVGDQALQKAIDYACGAGADCSPIIQNGACYQPNTVKDHCNYAVNSYFQRKGQAQGSCDFAGAATQSQNPPTSASTCVYPSSPGT